jgi:hypothetical protein
MRLPLAVCLGIFCCATQAGESAYTVRATELKAKPFSDSATVANLPENRKVEMLLRQSSWTQVKTQGATGWVKMLSLRLDDPTAPKKSGDSGLGALFSAAATGSSGSTTTTGVKGVTEENLKNAQPNPQALKAVQGYAVSKADAQNFAKVGKLAPQKLDYFTTGEAKK